MNKWYKNWWVHNMIGHPLMQLLNSVKLKEYGRKVHDGTLPPEEKMMI